MPRKLPGVRKERVKLSLPKANRIPPRFISVGCMFRPYLPIYTLLRGSCQEARGINSGYLFIQELVIVPFKLIFNLFRDIVYWYNLLCPYITLWQNGITKRDNLL